MTKHQSSLLLVAAVAVVCTANATLALLQEYKSGVVWPEPKVVAAGAVPGAPPADAVVLFDGKDLAQWKNGENWEVKDGYAITRKSGISTKEAFGDCQLHVEFATPAKVKGNGQGRGNSGIYLMERYEVQVLDSVDNPTYFDGQCGAIYKQSPPMVNVSRKPGEWQTYDIVFEAPAFGDDGKVTKPAYITVLHNGVLIHNHFELKGSTNFDRPAAYVKHAARMPISLQFHGDETMFRNIWVREFAQLVGVPPATK